MTTTNPEQMIPEEVRDSIFKELKKINKNNICIDCQKKNPVWASIHLGIHLCIDCAGKHRQYGVIYSFVKSTNLDKWNRKQIVFMQKGGNQRAIEYFTKCGVIGQTNKHIDYKSPIVQRYKGILTAQVQSQISGKPLQSQSKPAEKSKTTNKIQKVEQQQKIDVPKQIPNAQSVQMEQKGKKKNKKKIGKKINLQDFDNLVLDDGVPIQQKQKIVKAYESNIKKQEQKGATTSTQQRSQSAGDNPVKQQVTVQQPKQMTEQQAKQKLQQLKSKQNTKSISSQQFKDTSANADVIKNNLNKLQGSQSISSSQLFGGQEATEDGTVDKIKDFVADAGGKLYGKLSSYWPLKK